MKKFLLFVPVTIFRHFLIFVSLICCNYQMAQTRNNIRFAFAFIVTFSLVFSFFLIVNNRDEIRLATGASSSFIPSSNNWFNNDKIHSINNQQDQQDQQQAGRPLKYILLWNVLPGKMNSLLPGSGGQKPFQQFACEYSDCFLEPDRNYLPIERYDAVVFTMNSIASKDLLAKTRNRRRKDQRFVFLSLESPVYTFGQTGADQLTLEIEDFADFFNWTMSYRNDADLPLFYGSVKPRGGGRGGGMRRNFNKSEINRTSGTTTRKRKDGKGKKFVAWMASHCLTDSRREDYIRHLKRYIGVDVYGDCGNLRCPKDPTGGDSDDRCYDLLEMKYKFYLSFENSICTDYVTEKFFQIMARDLVPVVYGGANYSHIAPPHSYIDAMNYSAKDLAAYLNKLNANDTLYEEYFRWKGDYVVESGQSEIVRHAVCDLCRKLHTDNEPKVYDRLQLLHQWVTTHQCI